MDNKMDNKMVKELADTLEYLCFADTDYDEDDNLIPNYKGIAEELINVQGYRKIDEEYQELLNQNKGLKEENGQLRLENNDLESQIENKSKETAEKILTKLQPYIGGWVLFKELEKEYGIEVEIKE